MMQVVDREPDRPAPVRVAAEQAAASTRPARSRRGTSCRRARARTDARVVRATARAARAATGTRPRRASAAARAAAAPAPTIENSRRSPCRRVARADDARRIRGRLLEEPVAAGRRTSGSRSSVAGPSSSTAQQRDQPDHRSHPQRHLPPVRQVQRRRSRSRPPRPTGPASFIGGGDESEVLEELRREVLVGAGRARPAPARSPACSRQYIAIQAVPSRCSRCAADGQRRRPIERADVVQPEEAALEHVVALGVLAVHPPREVEQQLVEHPLEERRSRARRRSGTRAAPPTRAPAG